jgi:Escherichia/Staphylococcus phage prohead protease
MLRKTLSISECQIKADDGSGTFSGYASVFNSVDSVGDTILPGAYQETLSNHGFPKMFLQHESWELPIGKWVGAKEDDHGLFVQGELTLGMTRANDTHAALKHQTLDGLSIGFRLKAGDYEESDEFGGDRVIKRVDWLAEVSPVVFPADGKARIDLGSVKSELEHLKTVRDFEYFLRDAGGFSKGLAGAIVSRAKVVFGQRDADDENDAKASQELVDVLNRLNRTIPALSINQSEK